MKIRAITAFLWRLRLVWVVIMGVGAITIGLAAIYWPIGLIVFGVLCVASVVGDALLRSGSRAEGQE